MALAFLTFSGTSGDTDVMLIQTGQRESTQTTVAEIVDTVVRFSDLPAVSLHELPIEAIETLILIDDGGPYRYRQDDSTFQNREGILPDREREDCSAVDTPGSPDRGARRIVAGANGERRCTDDQHDSFREITG